MRRKLIPLLVLLIGAVTLWQRQADTPSPAATPAEAGAGVQAPTPAPERSGARGGMPAEAWDTVELIQEGGPFPYRQDGTTFGNREGLLPEQPRGYYREYTVPTPGSGDRGARRIVTGGTPPSVWYYTADHYRSFRPFEPD